MGTTDIKTAIAMFADRNAQGTIVQERTEATLEMNDRSVLDKGCQRAVPAAGAVGKFLHNREIYGEGDDADAFFEVASGVVRICKFLVDGRRQIVAFYVPGDVFGFEVTAKHSLSAEAVCDSVVISHPRCRIETLAATSQVLSYQLFLHAMRRLTEAQDHSLLLGHRSAVERVAAFLFDWSTRSLERKVVTLVMPRLDIADYLGLTIETVSRTLSYLERKALIELPTVRQIILKDAAGLRDLNS